MGLFQRVLVPTDFSECAAAALAMATNVARAHDAELVILHVAEAPFHYAGYGLPEQTIATIHKDLRDAVDAQIAQAAAQAGHAKLHTVQREGVASREIIAYAAENAVDLIVIGTRGRTGIKHLLLGSTAERVVREAPCPVLTVRAAP